MVDAIKRALGGEGRRSDLLQMITAARGAINGLMPEVLKDHVREYLLPRDTEARRARVGCRRGANRDHPLLSRLGCARDRVRFARYYPATKMWMLNRSTLKLAFALPLELRTTSLSITRPQGVVSIADRRPTHVFSLMAGIGVPERSPPSKPQEAFRRCLPIFRFCAGFRTPAVTTLVCARAAGV